MSAFVNFRNRLKTSYYDISQICGFVWEWEGGTSLVDLSYETHIAIIITISKFGVARGGMGLITNLNYTL